MMARVQLELIGLESAIRNARLSSSWKGYLASLDRSLDIIFGDA